MPQIVRRACFATTVANEAHDVHASATGLQAQKKSGHARVAGYALLRNAPGLYLAATVSPGAARKARIGLLVAVSQIFTSPSNPPVASRLVPGCTAKLKT